MWILVQTNKDKTRYKYLASHDYDALIEYIHRFSNIKKYSDYKWVVNGGEVNFDIMLGEEIRNDRKEIQKNKKKK